METLRHLLRKARSLKAATVKGLKQFNGVSNYKLKGLKIFFSMLF